MAYILGYFAADGSMLKNNRGACFIEFHSIDKILLERLKSALDSSHKISVRKSLPNSHTLYRLQIGSKEIYSDLLKLGLTPAKSKTITFPNIPVPLVSHFVRGYFDGDGHVSVSKYHRKGRTGKLSKTILSGFTSGSEMFLVRLLDTLKQYANIFGGSLYKTSAYRLTLSVKDSKKLYDFLYKNAGKMRLARKKVVFESYFK